MSKGKILVPMNFLVFFCKTGLDFSWNRVYFIDQVPDMVRVFFEIEFGAAELELMKAEMPWMRSGR